MRSLHPSRTQESTGEKWRHSGNKSKELAKFQRVKAKKIHERRPRDYICYSKPVEDLVDFFDNSRIPDFEKPLFIHRIEKLDRYANLTDSFRTSIRSKEVEFAHTLGVFLRDIDDNNIENFTLDYFRDRESERNSKFKIQVEVSDMDETEKFDLWEELSEKLTDTLVENGLEQERSNVFLKLR